MFDAGLGNGSDSPRLVKGVLQIIIYSAKFEPAAELVFTSHVIPEIPQSPGSWFMRFRTSSLVGYCGAADT